MENVKNRGVGKYWKFRFQPKIMLSRLYNFQFQMKATNSTEKKGMLEHDLFKGNGCEADSASYLTNCSTSNSHSLKRSESSYTLGSEQSDVSIIEERYQALEEDYKVLLQETRRKKELFHKQQLQLQKYRIKHQKDTKQIQRLQSLISFAKKSEPTPKKSAPQALTPGSNSRRNGCSVPKDKNLGARDTVVGPMEILSSKNTCSGLRKTGQRQEKQAPIAGPKFLQSICLN